MKKKEIILIILSFFVFCSAFGKQDLNDVIVLQQHHLSKSKKEAILILPGLGDSKRGRRNQKKYFSDKGYDLYIPDFQDKNSYSGTVDNLAKFWNEQDLNQYKKVHVFSYILGSWVLNDFIRKENPDNINSIVYDRSPLQERVPFIVTENIPGLSRLVSGQLIFDFAKIPYCGVDTTSINIGIMIESKATSLIRMFKKKSKAMGEVNWDNPNFDQLYHDQIYVKQNHDQMYFSFDDIGEDILNFFRIGKFSANARRIWYGWDPYVKKLDLRG